MGAITRGLMPLRPSKQPKYFRNLLGELSLVCIACDRNFWIRILTLAFKKPRNNLPRVYSHAILVL